MTCPPENADSSQLPEDPKKALIETITKAFAGVKLGNGIGLWEAQAIDDNESDETRAEYRTRDEEDDWQNVTSDTLRHCYSSPSFLDEEGTRFYLPAYLISTVNDEHPFGYVFYLSSGTCQHNFGLLNPQQRAAVRDFMIWASTDPDHAMESNEIFDGLHDYWIEESD